MNDSVVEYGFSSSYGLIITNSALTVAHAVALAALSPATTYHYRVRSTDVTGNQSLSGDFSFTTNPSAVVNDLIIDNPAAVVSGSWSTGTTAATRV